MWAGSVTKKQEENYTRKRDPKLQKLIWKMDKKWFVLTTCSMLQIFDCLIAEGNLRDILHTVKFQE